ncbi:hypothetical protein TMEN_6776 [Trichophyton mentagrophytes]|nr:hypothetical protein TMEN_6776 [Trichophyton mentagrophytes]
MPGPEWKNDEIAIAIYFTAYGYQHHLIALLLSKRGFHRTKASVDNKLIAIRNDNPQLGTGHNWNAKEVNMWSPPKLLEF